MERRVRGDGLAGDLVERDVLCREPRCCCNDHRMTQPLRIVDGPVQRLHTAERPTNNGGPLLNAEPIRQPGLGLDPVPDGNHGKIRPIGAPGVGIDGCGAGAAVATANVVQAHHEEVIGINGFPGADAGIPPAGLTVVRRVVAGRVVVAAEGVTDQYGIVGVCVQFPIGLHNEIKFGKRVAALESHRLRKMKRLGFNDANRVGGLIVSSH